MTLVFYLVIAGYAAILGLEARETKGRFPGTRRQAVWTLYVFLVTDLTIVAGALAEHHLLRRADIAVSLAGIGLIAGKILLKRWAMGALGRHFNVHIVVGESHRLIREGPYRHMRHPAYFARVLGMIGIPLMLNAYYTLMVVPAIDLIFIFVRIRIEERQLTERFGEEYTAYRRQSWAIIPFRSLLAGRNSG